MDERERTNAFEFRFPGDGMTLQEIARQALVDATRTWTKRKDDTHLLHAQADAVLLAVLPEISKVARFAWGECGRGCEAAYILKAIDDLALLVSQGAQTKKEEEIMRVPKTRESSEPLTHASISEPRTNEERCECGHKRARHGVVKTAVCYECSCQEFTNGD